jgi:type IV pilus assembly protein PilN
MIKVNLLPVKKKKKRKPVPAFLISTILITIVVIVVLAYVIYYFNSQIETREAQVRKNEKIIKELQEKIKAVEDYERRNALFRERKKIIEQLGKNKTVPVKVVDEISSRLPIGVWLRSMNLSAKTLNMTCTGFTNTDVVQFVNSLKKSEMLTDVFLQESVQTKTGGYTLYNFKVTMKVKI